jgi:DNA modification methylase
MKRGEMNNILQGDALEVLKTLESESVDCCVTSPPYWGLRDYGVEGQFGLEKTPEEYVAKMVEVFRDVRRVIKKEGTLWLNLGDSYCGTGSKGELTDPKYSEGRNGQVVALNNKIEGLKPKDLVGIPWRVAFALQADGWYLRQDIIWHKPNPMPESVTDRCTKSHEYVFLMTKSAKYYFDNEAIKEKATSEYGKGIIDSPQKYSDGIGNQSHSGWMGGDGEYRNKRSVWTITTKPYSGAHFATFPEELIIPMIKAGCPKGGIVLDPFSGAGTTCMVAKKLERNYLGIELNQKYIEIAEKRIEVECGTLF